MTDTLVLPKSGLVLPRHPAAHPRWQARCGDHEFIVESVFLGGSRWIEMECYVAPNGTRYCRSRYGTKEDCIAWLDARVLELRAALLPDHDAMLDTIGEAIARASDEYVGGSCECDDDDDDPAPYAKRCAACKAGPRHIARAVLAALAEGGKS